ncbi:hypothetical protein J3F84DRAFT_357963 [Trichoderma pleuroticola]
MLPAGAYLTAQHPEEMLPMRVIPVTAFATGGLIGARVWRSNHSIVDVCRSAK